MSKQLKTKAADAAAQLKKEKHRKNRLNSIKNELESGYMTNWSQMFAIMTIKAALNLIDVKLNDHFIITQYRWSSLYKQGFI